MLMTSDEPAQVPVGRDSLPRPGDFLYVAPGAVHRESNPGNQESHIVVVRSGSGVPVVNVEDPPGS
jgi:uncharacterized RmlC-like cupin family protein